MIAGAFTPPSTISDENQKSGSIIDRVLRQFSADNFIPLASIPHDTRRVYQDQSIGLIQQSVTLKHTQGIAYCNESGQVCISWSRLDNPNELEKNLSSSDNKNNNSSLILASYQRWQNECPKHIKGSFAFAIYDPKRQTLLLARDIMGVIPLYYNDGDPCFLFATNLAAIAKLNEVKNQACTQWITQYLFKHQADESLTGFTNIKKLPAGHTLLVSADNKPAVTAYWQLEDLITEATPKNSLDTYQRAFDQASIKQVKHKQTIGLELSGGLDSSSIMASLMEQQPDSDVHCFSRAYFTLEKEPIQALHKRYPNTNNHLWSDPSTNQHSFNDDLDHYISIFGLPDEHSLAIGCSDFLRVANQHDIKMVLSGYGGDEFSSALAHDVIFQLIQERRFLSLYQRLTGNPVKRLIRLLRLLRKQPSKTAYTPAMLNMKHPDIIHAQKQQTNHYQQLNNEKNHNRRLIQQWRAGGVLRLESHTLAGAAKGISFEWPFMDENVLACYLSSPIKERFGTGGQTRWLHRRAFTGRLPSIIINKKDKKIGTLNGKNDLHDIFIQRFPNKFNLHSLLQNMVDEKAVNDFLTTPSKEQKQSNHYRHTVKAIYSINCWLKHYF